MELLVHHLAKQHRVGDIVYAARFIKNSSGIGKQWQMETTECKVTRYYPNSPISPNPTLEGWYELQQVADGKFRITKGRDILPLVDASPSRYERQKRYWKLRDEEAGVETAFTLAQRKILGNPRTGLTWLKRCMERIGHVEIVLDGGDFTDYQQAHDAIREAMRIPTDFLYGFPSARS